MHTTMHTTNSHVQYHVQYSSSLILPCIPCPQVTGQHMDVLLSNAFVGVLHVATTFGDVKLNNLRGLATHAASGNGDVVIEVGGGESVSTVAG